MADKTTARPSRHPKLRRLWDTFRRPFSRIKSHPVSPQQLQPAVAPVSPPGAATRLTDAVPKPQGSSSVDVAPLPPTDSSGGHTTHSIDGGAQSVQLEELGSDNVGLALDVAPLVPAAILPVDSAPESSSAVTVTQSSPAVESSGASAIHPSDGAIRATRATAGVIDNLGLALDVLEKLVAIAQTVPFVQPVAGALSQIVKAYQEVKATDDKRDGLLTRVAEIAQNLCSTIHVLKEANHVDLIDRLQRDIDHYTRLLEEASSFLEAYNDLGVLHRVAAHNQLKAEFADLQERLASFSVRFRMNRLVELTVQQVAVKQKLDKVHNTVLAEKLEKWLQSPPDMLRRQYEIQKLRQDGTGLWLLNGEAFMVWQDNPAGTGKSVLSSSVVKKLNEDHKQLEDLGHSSALGFFYFDVNHRDGHMVDMALRRIILQLSAQAPNSYHTLEIRCDQSKGQITPNFEGLQGILKDLLLELGRTYIVLDALDECADQELPQLLDLISTLRAWSQESPLHLLITSQRRPAFTKKFTNMTCVFLESGLIEPDIHSFISHEVQNNASLGIWVSRADEVIDRVSHKSKGMFRLATCLLLELSHCTRQRELDETLANLPADLFGIYDRFFERICPKDRADVVGVLRWLLFSKEPLQLTQLAEAISFDFSNAEEFIYTPTLRAENVDAIPGWLEGLANVHHHNSTNKVVVLGHASVQDYLLSPHFAQKFGFDIGPDDSHSFIARGCLAYLIHTLGNEPYPPDSLMLYAPYDWCYHLLRARDRTTLLFPVMQLLEDSNRYLALDHILGRVNHLKDSGPVKTPIALCTQLDYAEGVSHLLNNGADVNQFKPQNQYLLEFAVRNKSTQLVSILLDHGADMNHISHSLTTAASVGHIEILRTLLARSGQVQGDFGNKTALASAALKGHTEIAQLLLKHGAEVDPNNDSEPVRAAAMNGHTNIVQLLLNHGAEVNPVKRGTPLQAAANNGHLHTVRLLLDRGAKVNTDNVYRAPLQVAAWYHHTEVVQLLLNHGAELNPVNASETPLQAALSAREWNEPDDHCTETAKLLLDHGADVNLVTAARTLSPLRMACWHGWHTRTIQLLLRHGAEVNPVDTHKTPLQLALLWDRTKTIQLLLDHGAEVNPSNYEATPLEVAANNGYTEVVQLLLNHGAELNPVKRQTSPLQVAANNGHLQTVQILLDHGAEVNTDNLYKAPLLAAALNGHTQTVQLLLNHGAELNLANAQETPLQAAGRDWKEPDDDIQFVEWPDYDMGVNPVTTARTVSPLQGASLNGHTQTVQLLLDHGAEVNPDNTEATALQAAASNGHTQTVQLLLNHGAELNPVNAQETPLQAAASNGHTQTLQLLLDLGAEVNLMNNSAKSPLQCAASLGHTQAVQLLLAHRAEVNLINDHPTPLNAAVSKDHVHVVQLLLDHGAEVNPVNTHETPLQVAASKGHKNTVHILLDHGAEVNPANDHKSPLQAAALTSSTQTVHLLLDHGAEVNPVNEHKTPLQAAASGSSGGIQAIQLFLDQMLELNPVNTHETPWQFAASEGHQETVQLLLDHGAEVNPANAYETPLQSVTYTLHIPTIQRLLDLGAEVNSMNNSAKSPLQCAAMLGHTQTVQLLLDHRAEVNLANDHPSPLNAAASKDHIHIVQLLLDHGAEVNPADDHESPLQAAAFRGSTQTVQLLLDHNAEVNPINAHRTPLQAAAYGGRTEIIALLLRHGAEDRTSEPALGFALYNNQTESVRFLLNNGADPNALVGTGDAKSGKSLALAYACHNCSMDIVHLLLKHGADVNAPDAKYGNALGAAMKSLYSDPDIVQLLREHGAVDVPSKEQGISHRHWGLQVPPPLI